MTWLQCEPCKRSLLRLRGGVRSCQSDPAVIGETCRFTWWGNQAIDKPQKLHSPSNTRLCNTHQFIRSARQLRPSTSTQPSVEVAPISNASAFGGRVRCHFSDAPRRSTRHASYKGYCEMTHRRGSGRAIHPCGQKSWHERSSGGRRITIIHCSTQVCKSLRLHVTSRFPRMTT